MAYDITDAQPINNKMAKENPAKPEHRDGQGGEGHRTGSSKEHRHSTYDEVCLKKIHHKLRVS
jgi:hypothetical protein